MKLFHVSVSYASAEGNKKSKETYAIDAFTYSEAEVVANKLAEEYGLVEFEIKSIKPTTYSDVFKDTPTYEADDNTHWYIAKVAFVMEDGKKTKNNILVKGTSMANALNVFEQHMKGTISDYETVTLNTTDIYNVVLK